jgi:hypothetical protein
MIISVYDENCQFKCLLNLKPKDIEEAIGRCGWTCLDGAEDVSVEDKAEIDRLHKQGFATMTTQTGEEALKWWNDRKISNPRTLICCCCGGITQGRQWLNRDTGYGLCEKCAERIPQKYPNEDMRGLYGIKGIYYSLKS